MYCCQNCFLDPVIMELIENESNEIGNCEYCYSEDVYIYDIHKLSDLFEILFSYYHPTEHGEHYIYHVHDPNDYGDTLYSLLQDDWEVFSDEASESLLYDIVNHHRDGEVEGYIDESYLFSRASDSFSHIDGTFLWGQLSNSLKSENRFFPRKELDLFYESSMLLNDIENIIKDLVVNVDSNLTLYRARVGQYLKSEELGPPPKDIIVKGGRANPPGISVLYCAMTLETAIAEVRPWTNATVTTATLRAKTELRFVDLSKIESIVSPFQFEDNIYHQIENHNLLSILHDVLSKPVDPNKTEIDYVPSQYLTEFIKSLGYDGIIFKSSLGNSNNIVIYNPEKISIEKLAYFRVTNVKYDFIIK